MEKIYRGLTYRKAKKLIKKWRDRAERYSILKDENAFSLVYWDGLILTNLICADELEKSLEVEKGGGYTGLLCCGYEHHKCPMED